MANTVKCYISGWVTLDVGDNDTDGMVKEAEQTLRDFPESISLDGVKVEDIEVIASDSSFGSDPDELYENYRDMTRGLRTA